MVQSNKNRRWIKWMIVGLVVLLSGCTGTRQWVYEKAMAHERAKAGLVLKTLTVNGKTISLLESERRENKPTLVLVHGFGASKENWIRFSGYLTDDWHVVAMDLPGHGDSVKDFDLSYGFSDQVGYVNEIITYLNIEKFHMAGNSMGGGIAAMYSVTWPDQILSLCLIDPAGIFIHEAELAGLLAQGDNPLIVETEDDFYRLMDFALEKKPYIPWPIAGVMAKKTAANHILSKKMFAELHGEEMAKPYGGDLSLFAEKIPGITAPTLIIWGSEDRIIHVDNAAEFQRRIPGAKLTVLDGVGHAPMIEVPEKSAKIFMDFIAALPDSRDTVEVRGEMGLRE